MHASITTVVGAILVVSTAGSAAAQNLVANGDFTADILDWQNLDATKQWSEFDPFADPLSGSLRISHTGNGGTEFVNQCVAIEAGATYGFEFWSYALGPETNGVSEARLRWYMGASCGGAILESLIRQSSEQGVWTRASDVVAAPANAGSASIVLGARKFGEGATPELLVHFDAVYLPEPGAVAAAVAIAALVGLRSRRSGSA